MGQHMWDALPATLFSFAGAGTTRRELNVAVLAAFAAANERLTTALTLDDLLTLLAEQHHQADEADVLAALTSLASWNLIDVAQNHAARYATAEEFERKNLTYALTRDGEAAIAGIAAALLRLASRGSLQSAVLDAIATKLHELAAVAADPTTPDQRIATTLSELEGHLEGLTTSTRAYNAELQRLLRDDVTDLAVLDDVKHKTVTYLEEYVASLDRHTATIRAGLAAAGGVGVATIHRRALVGADLPQLPGDDPAPRYLAARAATWDGMLAWFDPADHSAPRVDELRDIARRAVVSLLRVLERLRESRRQQQSTATDLRTLARWFEAAPSAADCHQLYAAAFGLWPARHPDLELDDADDHPPTATFADVPPAPISPLLRTRGRNDHVARTATVPDVTAGRAQRAALAAAERAQLTAAWNRLVTDGPTHLSDLPALDLTNLRRLTVLISRALTRPRSDGSYRATTTDGLLELVLRAPPSPRPPATLRTDAGTLTCTDYLIDIYEPAARRRGSAPAAARPAAVPDEAAS